LINSLKLKGYLLPVTGSLSIDVAGNRKQETGNRIEDVKIVLSGSGAAGFRIAELLWAYGFRDITTFDSKGAICQCRE